MPNPAPVLVIINSKSSLLRRFEGWWREDGLDLHQVSAHEGEALPDLDGYSALVMLGGGLMPDDDVNHPWLARERELAVAAVERGLPTLGICLGAQLLAYATGGTVRAAHGLPESGSTTLTRHAEADGDPLFGPLEDSFTAIEHRKDMITELPPGAVWLASSERCPIQGFRLGERAWGTQFHPEVDGHRVRGWNRDSLVEQGYDPDEVVRRAEADEPAGEQRWRAFAGRFAEVVRTHAATRVADQSSTELEGSRG